MVTRRGVIAGLASVAGLLVLPARSGGLVTFTAGPLEGRSATFRRMRPPRHVEVDLWGNSGHRVVAIVLRDHCLIG